MQLRNILENKNMSVYQCAKKSGVPYTTLLDIVKGKTNLEKCTAETVYKLAKVFDVTMETLLEECIEQSANQVQRNSFEIFKSNICHMVKDKGDIDFIVETLKNEDVRTYWERQWYRESFYLLAMVDYLSRENDLPMCTDYEDIRQCSLEEPLYPRDITLVAKMNSSLDIRQQSMEEAIPEFLRFNIVEKEVRNVC